MKNFIAKISELGVSESDDTYDRRSIVLTNQISLIIFCAVVVVFMFRTFYYLSAQYYFQPTLYLFNFLQLIPISLNYLKFTQVSRILINYIFVFFVWMIFINEMKLYPNLESSIFDGLRVYLLALSCIPYLILNKRKPFIFILGILPTLLSIFFLESVMSYFFGTRYDLMTRGTDYELMNMRVAVSYVVIGTSCYGLHAIIVKTDKENTELMQKLNIQNKLLVEQQKLLNDSNLQLEKIVEERTEKIRSQNKRIISYAYTNAHHIRGPIARLLGLINLAKIEPEDFNSFYLEKLEKESRDLDEIVKNLSKELDEIPDNFLE